ncbi:MAG: nucleoside triphosphate pyrophosphohydrolase [Candidatus Competibacteraceae bacterium]
MQEVKKLLNLMERLRDPHAGCPWDRAQTYASIAPYTIEEAYEVADAIARGDRAELKQELGDLLFQVVFHAQLAREEGAFTFAEVAAAVTEKMIRRHPHVFGETRYADRAEQSHAWERLKAAERDTPAASVLDGIPATLPAMTRATKLQRKAAQVGFDWTEPMAVLEKITEELTELRHELETGAAATRLTEELGDVLFACVNLARHLAVEPESALRMANLKFERRFRRIEDWLKAAGRSFQQAGLAELDALWERAKAEERGE